MDCADCYQPKLDLAKILEEAYCSQISMSETSMPDQRSAWLSGLMIHSPIGKLLEEVLKTFNNIRNSILERMRQRLPILRLIDRSFDLPIHYSMSPLTRTSAILDDLSVYRSNMVWEKRQCWNEERSPFSEAMHSRYKEDNKFSMTVPGSYYGNKANELISEIYKLKQELLLTTVTYVISNTQMNNNSCSTLKFSDGKINDEDQTRRNETSVESMVKTKEYACDFCPQAIEEQAVERALETIEAVMVCDISTKTGKKHSRRDETKGGLQQYRYSPAVDAILFNQYTGVSASMTSPEEIYNVYELRTSELQAKYVQELERMLSYESDFQSRHMNATALARSGLINLKKNTDAVVCVWCCVQFCNFRQPLDAAALHLAYSEHVCEFIKHYDRINVPFKKVGNQRGGYLELLSSAQGITISYIPSHFLLASIKSLP